MSISVRGIWRSALVIGTASLALAGCVVYDPYPQAGGYYAQPAPPPYYAAPAPAYGYVAPAPSVGFYFGDGGGHRHHRHGHRGRYWR